MWGEYLGQILTGLAGLVTAVGGIMLTHTRETAAELAACRMDSRRWRITALRHMHLLERLLWQAGMSVPDRPEELL